MEGVCHCRTVKHRDPNEKHCCKQAACQPRRFARRDAQCRRKETSAGLVTSDFAAL